MTDSSNNIENIDKIGIPSIFENSPTISKEIFEGDRTSVDLEAVKNTDMNMDQITVDEKKIIGSLSDQENKDYNPTPLEDMVGDIKDEQNTHTTNSSAVFDDLMTVLMNYDAEELILELKSNTVFGTTYILTTNTDRTYSGEKRALYMFNEMTKETKTLLRELSVTDNTKIGLENIETFKQ